jgi:succinate dehydrogenase/fumarate reductase cytochrome b subunit
MGSMVDNGNIHPAMGFLVAFVLSFFVGLELIFSDANHGRVATGTKQRVGFALCYGSLFAIWAVFGFGLWL